MKTNTLDFDAQALREKILDLAMRGKLVKQDPNDEPASMLLEKDGLRESKEKPHEIPKSWSWIVLGSGAKFINGRAYKKSELLNDSSLTPILRVGNLFTNSSYYYSDLKLESNKYIDNGDLIYAWSASFGPQIWNGGHVIYHYHIWKVLPEQSIDKQFLYYFLLDKRNVIGETDLHGSTMKHITKTNMEHLSFPLPPLEEQSRIAAKIAQLFALLRKVETSTQQYTKLQTLLKSKVLDLAMRGKLVKQDPNDEPASVLLEKIKAEKEQLIKEKKIKRSKPLPPITDEEKSFEIPDSWEWVRLGEITALVTKGTTPKGGKSVYVNKGINYYRAENVAFSGLSKESLNYIPLEMHEGLLKRSILKEKDILITIAGTLGRVTYVKKEDLPGNTNQAVSISRPIDSDEIDEKFLTYTLTSLLQQVVKNNKTTSIPNLTLRQIEEIIFPFPPLSEQYRISTKLSQLFKFICKNKSSIS